MNIKLGNENIITGATSNNGFKSIYNKVLIEGGDIPVGNLEIKDSVFSLPEGVTRNEFDKGMRESMKAVSILVGKQFGIDIGYENLPDAVNSVINGLVETVAMLTHANAKPVYTQAMCDAGEFPAAGVTCEALIGKNWLVAEVFAIFNGICHVHLVDDDSYGFCRDANDLRPIDTRTDQEKLVDDIIATIAEGGFLNKDGGESRKIAERIIARFRITN